MVVAIGCIANCVGGVGNVQDLVKQKDPKILEMDSLLLARRPRFTFEKPNEKQPTTTMMANNAETNAHNHGGEPIDPVSSWRDLLLGTLCEIR